MVKYELPTFDQLPPPGSPLAVSPLVFPVLPQFVGLCVLLLKAMAPGVKKLNEYVPTIRIPDWCEVSKSQS